MSDTPRTDSQPQITPSDLEDAWKHNAPLVDAGFARQLERELTEAKRGAARYEVVRRMTSDDFRKLYLRCLFENLRFDDEVDKIKGLR